MPKRCNPWCAGADFFDLSIHHSPLYTYASIDRYYPAIMSVSATQRQTMAVSRLIRASKAPRSARAISTSPRLSAKSDPSTPNPSPSNPTTQTPPPPVTRASRFPFVGKPKVVLPSTPYTVSQPPQFPAPNDPFFQPSTSVTDGKGESAPPVPVTTRSGVPGQAAGYSDTTKAVVRGLARVMGYNSKASTAIRESGRMMRGIVEGIEKDRMYWYEGELEFSFM
jgi:cytochrome b pre-mRNA-processing protein 3